MISRKWKMTSNTGATGEIAFMDKMLADFRAFCRNDQNRLKDFWDDCVKKNNEVDEPSIEVAVDATMSDKLSKSNNS